MLNFYFLTMLSLGSLASAQGKFINSHLIQLPDENPYFTKLIVTANFRDKKTYVIDVKYEAVYDCLLDYPDTNYVSLPAYGLINNKPLVCDGNRNEKVNDCYLFHDAKWRKSVSLPEPSRFSGSTVIDNIILWIGGNRHGYNQKLSLLVDPYEGTVQPGPEIPFNVGGQCMVNINEDRVMFIGGIGGYNGTTSLAETRIYSFAQNSWEMGPTLTIPISLPACALITLGSKQVIFVAQYDGAAEYLELDGTNTWKQGPHLPYWIDWGRMNVVDGGQSAIFLGYSSTNGSMIFKLFCDNDDAGQCKWKPLELSLPFNGDLPVSIMIPNEIAYNDCIIN